MSGTPPLVTTDEDEDSDGASGEEPDLLLQQSRLHSSSLDSTRINQDRS